MRCIGWDNDLPEVVKTITSSQIEIALKDATLAQLVERNLAKVQVRSSSLLSRSILLEKNQITLITSIIQTSYNLIYRTKKLTIIDSNQHNKSSIMPLLI